MQSYLKIDRIDQAEKQLKVERSLGLVHMACFRTKHFPLLPGLHSYLAVSAYLLCGQIRPSCADTGHVSPG